MFDEFIKFVRDLYGSKEFVPLHEPKFIGNEKKYLLDTIDSTFISSVGEYVNEFERLISDYTGITKAIATVNGTSALHTALLLAGVKTSDEVITQSLTFAATCAAICYCNAMPVFVDIERKTLGMSPDSLLQFLEENCEVRDGGCWNRRSGKIIRSCVPMHTFGHPARIEEIDKICKKYKIVLIEDAAESLGSSSQGEHTGSTGTLSIFSFNGNKIITTGGGGMVVTNDEKLAEQAKHLTTTAKEIHPWAYKHNRVGYNYRLPNLNAAVGCAQMENLVSFVEKKREVAKKYLAWGRDNGVQVIHEPEGASSNYWLNAVLLEDQKQRDAFLEYTNANKVMTRPVWKPMHKLVMYQDCYFQDLSQTDWLEQRLVNIPSSVL